MQSGFIYILENPAMPGLVKVGKTKRHPNERAFELFTTGVPLPFEIAFCIWAHDIDESERLIHERLSSQRVNNSREFFCIQLEECMRVVVETVLDHLSLTLVVCDSVLCDDFVSKKAKELKRHPFEIPAIIKHVTDEEFEKAAVAYEAFVKEHRWSEFELEPASE